MAAYWNEYPPTHDLIGAYMGVGKKETASNVIDMERCSDQELDVFFRDLNGLGG